MHAVRSSYTWIKQKFNSEIRYNLSISKNSSNPVHAVVILSSSYREHDKALGSGTVSGTLFFPALRAIDNPIPKLLLSIVANIFLTSVQGYIALCSC